MSLASFPFSSKTIAVVVDSIVAGYSATEMETLWLHAGVEAWEVAGSTKETRARELVKALRQSTGPAAYDGAHELARLILVKGKPKNDGWNPSPSTWWPSLRDAVAADGWDFDLAHDQLVPTVAGIAVPVEISWMEAELDRRGWATAKGHYRQAVDSFASGNWAAANGQLRSFAEETMRTAGGTASAAGSGQVQIAINNLDAGGILSPGEADSGSSFTPVAPIRA